MDLCKIKAILLDIEGTTTSISFVRETLFPFVKKNIAEYVETTWEDEELREDLKDDIKLLKEQSDQDEKDKVEGLVPIDEDSKESVIKNVLWQMELDRKTTALKNFQGRVWRDAYYRGQLKGHLYPDVAEALKSWHKAGKFISSYSSASFETQCFHFSHSVDGNLYKMFSAMFDTKIGPKTSKESYEAIVKKIDLKIGVEADEILFLTDVATEAQAARDAGLQVAIVVREGNAPLDEETKKSFPLIKTFEEIVFEPSSKRAKLEDEKTEDILTFEEAKPENGEKMEVEEKVEAEPESQKVESSEEEKKVEADEKSEEVKEDEPKKVEADEKPEEVKLDEPKKEEDTPKEDIKPTNGEEKAANGEKVEQDEVKSTNGEKENGEEDKNGTAMEVDATNGQNGNSEPVVAKAVPVVKEAEIEATVAEEPVVAKPVAVEAPLPIEVVAE